MTDATLKLRIVSTDGANGEFDKRRKSENGIGL